MDFPRTIKVMEAAEKLGVDRTTIWRWVERGHLKAVTLPSGSKRITQEDFDQFLRSRGLESPEKRKVLILDDDPLILEYLQEVLEGMDLDLDVRACSNEIDGLLILGDFQPDLIILDYRLENLDGVSIAQKIRENESLQKVPIVMISGVIGNVPMKELGIQAFLKKPFGKQELGKVVADALSAGPG